jgi:hypothetical protein
MQVIGLNQTKLSSDFFELTIRKFRINKGNFEKLEN